MTKYEAVLWLRAQVPYCCGECPKGYDSTCTKAEADRCQAYRIASAAIMESMEKESRCGLSQKN